VNNTNYDVVQVTVFSLLTSSFQGSEIYPQWRNVFDITYTR